MITYEKIIYQLKFLEKMKEKKSFLTNYFNKFAKKIPYNIRISGSICCGLIRMHLKIITCIFRFIKHFQIIQL